jgi:magnesium chelatase family protein
MTNSPPFDMEPIDLQQISAQEHVKRGLEVAAAGAHHVLLIGAPESGKTLLARALQGLLPPLSETEAAGVATLAALAGAGQSEPATVRPWIAPAPGVSAAALFGRHVRRSRPGLVSLAHRGILFLDDLPSLSARLVRLPAILDDRTVTIEHAAGALTVPAAFQLVATARPCPCGWFGDPEAICHCTPQQVRRYQQRIPPALRERIDIHLEVPRVPYERLTSGRLGEPSAVVRERVIAARQRQTARFADDPRCATNADMGPEAIRIHCTLDSAGHSLMKAALRQLDLSAGAYQRILRIARTIADLAGAEQIGAAHLAESVQYRARPTL